MNLIKCFILLRSFIMTLPKNVLDAVAAANARITAITTALTDKIAALNAELANGTPITSADLDLIIVAINELAAAAPIPVATLPTTAP